MAARGICLGAWSSLVALSAPGLAQVTQRVSVASNGEQENDHGFGATISADGRYVVFLSSATNLVPGDTNGVYDVFLRDRRTGITERVSVSSIGVQANSYSQEASITPDGRYVVFSSMASNLDPADTNGNTDVFVRDRWSGTTELISFGSINTQSGGCSISADGRYVAFVCNVWSELPIVFVRDRASGAIEVVSGTPQGGQQPSDMWSADASISADGRYVAFSTYANGLVPGDTDGLPDVFVRDRVSGALECVSAGPNGPQGGRWSGESSLSADGRFVVFSSLAPDLVPGDTNASLDVFVRDRTLGTTERVSVDSSGLQGNGPSYSPSISADGRFVAFYSEATNLVSGDTNGGPDSFVHDRRTGTTERVNLNWVGAQGDLACYGCRPQISADGRYVAFDSFADNLVPGDTNGSLDIFVRDREHEGFADTCNPSSGGVVGCPCSNPPSGSDRGCDNSAVTGGAMLAVSGGEYLSSDSLLFTTRNEVPSSLSLLLQGTSLVPTGVIYGQGVRCVGGTPRRLYTRLASNGSVTVPNLGAGDPQVHERSAFLGDPILPGTRRWYAVAYRDPIVLGGCPGSSTFNTTQTREVTWKP